ncbi:MAG: glycosyltransferase N-terminal domain-containing protein, partial [Nitrospinota bacterium]
MSQVPFALAFRRHAAYALKAYAYLPITFTKRVLLGKDPYWRQYFWSKWGYLPRELKESVRGRPTLWLDAVGGGEVTQIITFCRKLRERFPEHKIVLSSNNKYSLDFASTIPELDFVFDTPWDLKAAARRALKALNPCALICIDNAPYPVLLREAQRLGVRTILVSGIMSSGFWKYSTYRRALPMRFFRYLDAIGVKDEEDREGYLMTGAEPEKIRVVGNMKYDIEFIKINDEVRQGLRESLGWGREDRVLVGGCVR